MPELVLISSIIGALGGESILDTVTKPAFVRNRLPWFSSSELFSGDVSGNFCFLVFFSFLVSFLASLGGCGDSLRARERGCEGAKRLIRIFEKVFVWFKVNLTSLATIFPGASRLTACPTAWRAACRRFKSFLTGSGGLEACFNAETIGTGMACSDLEAAVAAGRFCFFCVFPAAISFGGILQHFV